MEFNEIIWTVLFSVAVGSCAFMIRKTYKKWDNSPVIVSFAQNPTPIWEIPFPAVTICPQNKAKQTIQNFTSLYHKHKNLTSQEIELFEKLILVCDGPALENVPIKGNSYFEDDELINFLQKVAPQVNETIFNCRWNGDDIPCESLFQTTLNDEGICFTFNMLSLEELFTDKMKRYKKLNGDELLSNGWNLESGYKRHLDLETYPRRVVGAGVESGLDLLLRTIEDDLDYLCKTPIQGYKVVLHEPGDFPRSKTNYISAPLNQEVVIAVQPRFLKASDNLKGYKPTKRKCYFDDEMKLEFFQRYTQQNCNLESLTALTLEHCGCVSFYMPRNSTTKICSAKKRNCTAFIERKLLTDFFNKNKDSDEEYSAAYKCIPACFSLQYGAETSQAILDIENFFKAIELPNATTQGERIHITSLKIFFREVQFIATERNELYGAYDFLANCGGLFGLFTGFSILSLMEIIYYLTVRTWINQHLFGKYLMATPNDPDLFKKKPIR